MEDVGLWLKCSSAGCSSLLKVKQFVFVLRTFEGNLSEDKP